MDGAIQVSIIIITYNHGQFIEDCLNSILDQTYKNYEIIVIDDGSADNTGEIVKKFKDKIKYIYQENQGRGASRNEGIKQAKYDWIAFLDSDDLWKPDKLKKQVSAIINSPKIDVLLTNAYYFKGVEIVKADHLKTMVLLNQQPVETHGTLVIFTEKLYPYFIDENFVILSSSLMRKNCLTDVGLFNTTLQRCQDRDLWLRLSRKYTFAYINEILVRMRVHSLNDGPLTVVPYQSRVQLFTKALAGDGEWETKYRNRLKNRLGRYYYDLSGYYFYANNDLTSARRELKNSFKNGYHPVGLLVHYLATFLPLPAVKLARKARNIISGKKKVSKTKTGHRTLRIKLKTNKNK